MGEPERAYLQVGEPKRAPTCRWASLSGHTCRWASLSGLPAGGREDQETLFLCMKLLHQVKQVAVLHLSQGGGGGGDIEAPHS